MPAIQKFTFRLKNTKALKLCGLIFVLYLKNQQDR